MINEAENSVRNLTEVIIPPNNSQIHKATAPTGLPTSFPTKISARTGRRIERQHTPKRISILVHEQIDLREGLIKCVAEIDTAAG